jgi:hypothetical protein
MSSDSQQKMLLYDANVGTFKVAAISNDEMFARNIEARRESGSGTAQYFSFFSVPTLCE